MKFTLRGAFWISLCFVLARAWHEDPTAGAILTLMATGLVLLVTL